VNYLEYAKDYEIVNSKEFLDWIFSLMPKDVRNKEISERELKKQKAKIRSGKTVNPKTKIVKILLKLYKETMLNNKD
jgi:hypothetical protein